VQLLDTPRDLWYGTLGPHDAEIAIVGESWGLEERLAELPFVGQSGKELERMLSEVGIDRREVFTTNVFSAQPPGNEAWKFFLPNPAPPNLKGLAASPFALQEYHRLHAQLQAMPSLRLVIVAGNYALWALTDGCTSIASISTGDGATTRVPGGITSWRGSMLVGTGSIAGKALLPIIHPAAIMRAWYQRAVTVNDLRARIPQALKNDWRPHQEPIILAPPTFKRAKEALESYLAAAEVRKLRLAHDIETARGLITCMGFASGPYDGSGFALVLPFVRLKPARQFDSFWTPPEEATLVQLTRRLLTHPNVLIEGQNYVYDTQYLYRWLGIRPKCDFDTMLAHHLLFPGTPKGLDYLSSLYCRYHWYWKDDNKEWDLKESETDHLLYNAVDVLRTYEVATELRRLITEMGQSEQWEWEKKKAALALRMMIRGINIDKQRRAQVGAELWAHQEYLLGRLKNMVPDQLVPQMKTKGAKPWYRSTRQQSLLFYDILGMPRQINRKTDASTVNDEALIALKKKFPELNRLFDILLESRSVGVFYSTFVMAPLEASGRMVCSFNPAGTETFRWSSSTNAFGRGTNLQNVPAGDEE
jgi:uracil-DNA glycosylase